MYEIVVMVDPAIYITIARRYCFIPTTNLNNLKYIIFRLFALSYDYDYKTISAYLNEYIY